MVINTNPLLTAEDYFEFSAQTEKRYELIEGQLFEMPAPTSIHQFIIVHAIVWLASLKRGKVLTAPLDVKLNSLNVFQPDVMWFAPENTDCIIHSGVDGAPDLVIEILSPSTAKNDKKRKFNVYELAGVREYWIIDPKELTLEVWVLENGTFVKLGVFTDAGTFYSPTLQVDVKPSEFLKVD
jgi:Uma2 family endonuclease